MPPFELRIELTSWTLPKIDQRHEYNGIPGRHNDR